MQYDCFFLIILRWRGGQFSISGVQVQYRVFHIQGLVWGHYLLTSWEEIPSLGKFTSEKELRRVVRLNKPYCEVEKVECCSVWTGCGGTELDNFVEWQHTMRFKLHCGVGPSNTVQRVLQIWFQKSSFKSEQLDSNLVDTRHFWGSHSCRWNKESLI